LLGQTVNDPQVSNLGRMLGVVSLVGRTYNIESWTPQTELNITGGGGNDSFVVGGGAGQIDPLSGDNYTQMHINLNGGGGSNSLILNDSLNNDRAYQVEDGELIQISTTRPTYYVTDQSVTRDNVINGNWFNPVHLAINYQNVKDLQIWGGG